MRKEERGGGDNNRTEELGVGGRGRTKRAERGHVKRGKKGGYEEGREGPVRGYLRMEFS